MFEIIKNAGPVPTERQSAKYPFSNMEIGDAFDVALSGEKHITGSDMNRVRLQSSACGAGRRFGMKFTIRQLPDVIRCWRVA